MVATTREPGEVVPVPFAINGAIENRRFAAVLLASHSGFFCCHELSFLIFSAGALFNLPIFRIKAPVGNGCETTSGPEECKFCFYNSVISVSAGGATASCIRE